MIGELYMEDAPKIETNEVKLYPGIINETVERALGIQALISLEEVEGV